MKSQWDAFIFWFILKTSEWLFKHGKKAVEAPRKSENVDPLSIMWYGDPMAHVKGWHGNCNSPCHPCLSGGQSPAASDSPQILHRFSTSRKIALYVLTYLTSEVAASLNLVPTIAKGIAMIKISAILQGHRVVVSSPLTLLVGGWPTPLKNDGVRQLGWLFPIYGKMKNDPNHQPDLHHPHTSAEYTWMHPSDETEETKEKSALVEKYNDCNVSWGNWGNRWTTCRSM